MIIGLNFFGEDTFSTNDIPVTNINYCELKNGIYDRLKIDESITIPTTNTIEQWGLATRALGEFQDSLEFGNLVNNGLQVQKFRIKRRKSDELNDLTLGEINNDNSGNIEYYDYTQPNQDLIYSIVPVSENGLEGVASSVSVSSSFVGWLIVDKDTNEVITFDTTMNSSEPTVDTQLNQSRVQIDTFSKYSTIYYLPGEYENFTLSGAFIPEDGERSIKVYKKLVNLVKQHKPVLVKGSDGSLYVVDISRPQRNVLQNSFLGHDYIIMSVECVEIMDYLDYING